MEAHASRKASPRGDSPSPAVTACLGVLAGDRPTYEGLVQQRINSRVHRARWGSRAIAVKECFDASLRADPAAAQREFDALTALAAANHRAGTPNLTALPLAICAEHAVFAMTWVEGRTATDAILARTTSDEEASAIGAAAGLWLRSLHARRPLSARTGDFAARLEVVSQLAQSIGPNDLLVHRTASMLRARVAEASAVVMPASWIHGDMKTDNLLMSGAHLTGLDVQLVHENTVVYDIAPFLNHLRLLQWTPRGLPASRKLKLAADAFVGAYSPEAGGWSLPIAWLRAYLMVQALDPAQQSRSLRGAARRWAVRRVLADALAAMARSR